MLRFWPSPGQRHGVFVDATLDPAESCLRATLRLEQAATTVARARKIQKRLPIVDKRARRSEGLAKVFLYRSSQIFLAVDTVATLLRPAKDVVERR